MSPKHRSVARVQRGALASPDEAGSELSGWVESRAAAGRRPGNRALRRALPALTGFVMAALSAVLVIAPQAPAYADNFERGYLAGQQYIADGGTATLSGRGGYAVASLQRAVTAAAKVSAGHAAVSAPAVGTPDPGSAQAIAQGILQQQGLGNDQFSCLAALWNRESKWNVYAHSPTGAYGIPQALPGSKMASYGSDWATNPTTQILWGLGYIDGRYGSPCGAWAHSQSTGWY